MSPASSTRSKQQPEALQEPVIQQLIERGRSQGYLEPEDVRRAFEEAEIPMSQAQAVLRTLTKEGVTLIVNAAESAPPRRKSTRRKTTSASRAAAQTSTTRAKRTAAAQEKPEAATAVKKSTEDAEETTTASKKRTTKAASTKSKTTAKRSTAKKTTTKSTTKKTAKTATKKKTAATAATPAVEEELGLEATDLLEDNFEETGADLELVDDTDDEVVELEETTPAKRSRDLPEKADADDDDSFVLYDDDDDAPAAQVVAAGATADPVKDYLKQIGKVPLLNAEQEVELAKRIEAGLFAEEKLSKKGHELDPGGTGGAGVDR